MLNMISYELLLFVLAPILILVFLSLDVLFLTWLERKVIARIQLRYGPNRTGPFGLLQPLADALKLIQKEDIIPKTADKVVFTLAPIISFVAASLPFMFIPFSKFFQISFIENALIFLLATSALSAIGILLAAWGSNSKYPLLGGMRAIVQVLSYEIPLVLAVLSIVLIVGSFKLTDIVEFQEKNTWLILLQPLGFLIFFISGLAEASRVPFDLPESESELVAGFHTEYSGMKFALLLFAEYIHLILISILITIFYLGGWLIPGIYYLENIAITIGNSFNIPSHISISILHFIILIIKAHIIIFLILWITRGTLFRIRVYSLPVFSWKGLVPLSMINLIITAILVVM